MKELPSNYNYSMGPLEYDKIMCIKDPETVIKSLAQIKKPYESWNSTDNDIVVNITEEQWLHINYAIKLLMDAYGVHMNHISDNFMYDNNQYFKLDKKTNKMISYPYWWLDMFPTHWDNEKKQEISDEYVKENWQENHNIKSD